MDQMKQSLEDAGVKPAAERLHEAGVEALHNNKDNWRKAIDQLLAACDIEMLKAVPGVVNSARTYLARVADEAKKQQASTKRTRGDQPSRGTQVEAVPPSSGAVAHVPTDTQSKHGDRAVSDKAERPTFAKQRSGIGIASRAEIAKRAFIEALENSTLFERLKICEALECARSGGTMERVMRKALAKFPADLLVGECLGHEEAEKLRRMLSSLVRQLGKLRVA